MTGSLLFLILLEMVTILIKEASRPLIFSFWMYPGFPSAITPPLASHQTSQLSLPNYYHYQAIAPRRIIRSSYLLLGPFRYSLSGYRACSLRHRSLFSLRTESNPGSFSIIFFTKSIQADCVMELCDKCGKWSFTPNNSCPIHPSVQQSRSILRLM